MARNVFNILVGNKLVLLYLGRRLTFSEPCLVVIVLCRYLAARKKHFVTLKSAVYTIKAQQVLYAKELTE